MMIDQNLCIDPKVKNIFSFPIDCQFVSQLNFSNKIIANYIILLNNVDPGQ